MEDGKVTGMRSSQHKNDLAVPTNSAIGPSPALRRAATSKNPITCTLPSDAISHDLIHRRLIRFNEYPLALPHSIPFTPFQL